MAISSTLLWTPGGGAGEYCIGGLSFGWQGMKPIPDCGPGCIGGSGGDHIVDCCDGMLGVAGWETGLWTVKVSDVSLADGAGEALGFFLGGFLVTLSLGRARNFGFGFGAGGEVTTAIVGVATKGSVSGADGLLSV